MRRADGFTLVELLAAILVLAMVSLSAAAVIANTTRFASSSEVRQGLAHRAQQELERLSGLPYAQLANPDISGLAQAATPASPLYWLNPTAQTYRWDRSSGGMAADALVIDPAGQAPVSQTWTDGREQGHIYAFVTWVTDGRCGGGCPTSQNYKRITVAATLDSGGPSVYPVYVASIVSDPRAAPFGRVVNGSSNPLSDPKLTCTNVLTNATSECTQSAGSSSVNQWYLTDTPATSTYAAPSASHVVHGTVACPTGVTTGCPMPDLLSSSPTPGDPSTTLYDYSTDLTPRGGDPGGRMLQRDTVGCAGTPTADNGRSAMWTTPALTAPLTLNGRGGMSITTQTLSGVAASATLCLGLYDASTITNMTSAPPTPLGVLSYTYASWPTTPTPVSFTFDFVTGGTVVVPLGHRILARLWVAQSSGADIAILYDHPAYPSMLQLSSL